MKLALLESHIEWENKQKNIDHLIEILNQIKTEKIDAIFLPEMSFTGFSMNTAVTGETQKATVSEISKLSETYGISIGFGWVKNTSLKSENHYSIVSNGTEILDYTKIHPFSYSTEDQYFQGGEELCFCELKNFSISSLICYDLRFPEVFQILSKKADLIVVPANWPQRRREHWMTLLKARAIENQCYLAGINCIGDIGGLTYSGDTALYNPAGEVEVPQKICRFKESNLYIYEIENDCTQFREDFPVKKDRKEDLYQSLRRQ